MDNSNFMSGFLKVNKGIDVLVISYQNIECHWLLWATDTRSRAKSNILCQFDEHRETIRWGS
jgi:hypothetical protein